MVVSGSEVEIPNSNQKILFSQEVGKVVVINLFVAVQGLLVYTNKAGYNMGEQFI